MYFFRNANRNSIPKLFIQVHISYYVSLGILQELLKKLFLGIFPDNSQAILFEVSHGDLKGVLHIFRLGYIQTLLQKFFQRLFRLSFKKLSDSQDFFFQELLQKLFLVLLQVLGFRGSSMDPFRDLFRNFIGDIFKSSSTTFFYNFSRNSC